ncbi:homoserine O-acetyltransferase MetX [Aeromicrobium fastidiosum]|uniref:Homoserine O-acetyltransferase n=1 Tax=Aeromicrobium fastidiosum TaxID=52699 RepID=A0A641AQ77_9ACTN|nr:homoserine O-acetyltransferase [Aeromicrobium fastidiosum]KAA1380240.1 homoserine O-acetyltransferase [Aeromicrobium fastidiosum]MBP2389791.1 homoserine O-acetyltransferase [Aeromicrobium fastidiosum]
MSLAPGIDPSLVTGAWREGDPPGGRTFTDIGDLTLDSGVVLPVVRLAHETWGTFDGGNAVLILHALTGDSHVVGDAGPGHPTPGWWGTLVGPGRPIDTDRFFVVAANILGGCQGSTGPASLDPDGLPWGGSFPALTVRDQVRAEVELADRLGIERWHTVIGGSAGGMRALEWAVEHPARVERLFLLATSAAASAEQIALSRTQVSAIENDPAWFDGDYYDGPVGPLAGLDLARRIAHIAYRSEHELAARFGRDREDDGTWSVDSYLQHHGAKLVRRFDANAYVVLTSAMDTHDVGRGRGGIESALARVTARTVVAGIDSDRLYPLHQQQELADLIPGAAPLAVVTSDHGHDGFLVEHDQVGELASALLRL